MIFTNIDRVEALTLFLPRLALIVLPFPSFTDGRAYSLARQIRETGYGRELRAAGNVLPDQVQFMNGAQVFENSKVTRILTKDGKAIGVETIDGTIYADKVVIAAGMSTGRNFDEILRVLDSLQLTATKSVATPANWKQGEDVIILASVSDEAAKEKFPGGWKTLKPYLRLVPQPGAK